jgi:hypothetical protein
MKTSASRPGRLTAQDAGCVPQTDWTALNLPGHELRSLIPDSHDMRQYQMIPLRFSVVILRTRISNRLQATLYSPTILPYCSSGVVKLWSGGPDMACHTVAAPASDPVGPGFESLPPSRKQTYCRNCDSQEVTFPLALGPSSAKGREVGSEMWSAEKSLDVSEEHIASIFRAE